MLRDVGDSIGRRNEIWVFICDLVLVILGDDSDGRRLDCLGIRRLTIVYIIGVLYQLVDAVRGCRAWR